MELMLYRPIRSMVPFGGFFDSLFEEGFSKLFEGREFGFERFVPAVDIKESDKEIHLLAEVPGLTEKDVHVELRDHTLRIRGEKKHEKKDEEGEYRHYESFHGTFERCFRLPEDILEDGIRAKLSNGVLEISIPKSEKAKPVEIPIHTN